MKITLLRTGGILPLLKKAEKEVDWTDAEMETLLEKIKVDEKGPEQVRDGTSYLLEYEAGTYTIDIDEIPKKYKTVFEDLKDNLKIVKPG